MSWVSKIIYAFLLLTLIASPVLIARDYGVVPEEYLESLATIFLLGLLGVLYYLHGRDIRRQEAEQRKLEQELDISSSKLNEAFQYIGLVNRRLPLLKNLTTDLLAKNEGTKHGKKSVFADLLASAVNSIARTEWGMLRFVEMATQRTVREFVYTEKSYVMVKHEISNRELSAALNGKNQLQQYDNLYYFADSDSQASVRCLLIVPKKSVGLEDEHLVLQSIVDQAQLFHKYLY